MTRLWGVGPVTAREAAARGIDRLVDVRAVDEQALREAVGSMADWLRQLANGIDDRPVVAHREAKSSGSENTYPEDSRMSRRFAREIAEMAAARRCAGSSGEICWRARSRSRFGTPTSRTITRSHTAAPTRDRIDLTGRAQRLLERTAVGQRPVRLLGVSVHGLCANAEDSGEPADWLPFSAGTAD